MKIYVQHLGLNLVATILVVINISEFGGWWWKKIAMFMKLVFFMQHGTIPRRK